jgi:ribosomal protein S18 acetylase RimI-like enzyme
MRYFISYMRKLIRYKFVGSRFNFLKHIGIKKSKLIVYVKRLENKSFVKEKIYTSHSIFIRLCAEDDINRVPKEYDKSLFLKDLREGRIMVGAFSNQDFVGWLWLTFQKVYVPEIEKWVNLDCGFIWRVFVVRKFRKRGVGKEMVRHAVEIAKKTPGIKEVCATVETDNIPSQRLFESLSFIKLGIISYSRFFNYKKWKTKILEKSVNRAETLMNIFGK